jgi:TrmH family RNA methyltransferase
MGAISRVRVIYTDLESLLKSHNDLPIYGTLLEGENIYEKSLKSPAFIIMGNEGKGISPAIRELISEGLFIPSYPGDIETSESLNVGVATAITIAEFRRQAITK